MSKIKIGIIGAGNIADQHLKVINHMDSVDVCGISTRTKSKAEDLSKIYDISNIYDDIEELIIKQKPDGIMILVSADQIFAVAKKLIPYQIPLFIEKPPGISCDETKTLVMDAENFGTLNMVGYNRRFYSIFHKGIEAINQHGGLQGINVEGHERFWNVEDSGFSKKEKENWIFSNSTHTIDLLCFFGGEVESMKSFSSNLYQKNGDQFATSMKFKSGAIGTYVSHWYSPGGWCATLYGDGITVKYSPLEKGKIIKTDFSEQEIEPEDFDKKYKPGFWLQMNSFIKLIKSREKSPDAMDLNKALYTMDIATRIRGDLAK